MDLVPFDLLLWRQRSFRHEGGEAFVMIFVRETPFARHSSTPFVVDICAGGGFRRFLRIARDERATLGGVALIRCGEITDFQLVHVAHIAGPLSVTDAINSPKRGCQS